MQREVMFAGFGGQGILVSAKILAHAAMEAGILLLPMMANVYSQFMFYCIEKSLKN